MTRAAKTCPVCGKAFTPKNWRAVCCSKKCANRKRFGTTPGDAPRACPVCGKVFAGKTARAVYCSKSCAKRASYLRSPLYAAARRHKPIPTPTPQSSISNLQSSISKVRAYLSLPPAERYARRDELTPGEHKLAQRIYLSSPARTVAVNHLMH